MTRVRSEEPAGAVRPARRPDGSQPADRTETGQPAGRKLGYATRPARNWHGVNPRCDRQSFSVAPSSDRLFPPHSDAARRATHPEGWNAK